MTKKLRDRGTGRTPSTDESRVWGDVPASQRKTELSSKSLESRVKA